MARVDADRNLLLGILAQQMDFVTRDALFAAMNAWIIRKDTPLGALLVERGAPSPDGGGGARTDRRGGGGAARGARPGRHGAPLEAAPWGRRRPRPGPRGPGTALAVPVGGRGHRGAEGDLPRPRPAGPGR